MNWTISKEGIPLFLFLGSFLEMVTELIWVNFVNRKSFVHNLATR